MLRLCFPLRRSARIAGLALILAFAGCALGDRAELVYRQQHEALHALTLSIAETEPKDPDLAEELYRLEDELSVACAALREAGRRRIAGQDVGDELEWAVVASMDDCAQTAEAVERRLGGAGSEVAQHPTADPGFAPAGDPD